MSIAADLYRSSLIADSNRLELDLMRNSSMQRNLLKSGSKDLAAIAKKESQLATQRIQKETELKVAKAQLKNKNKSKKLDITV